jgi:hypothetical protein
MNTLMDQIATNAADYAVAKYGLHLTAFQQQRLWKRYYDSALAALMTFEELNTPRAIRARDLISQN